MDNQHLMVLQEEMQLSEAVEQALAVGDMSKLSAEHRTQYYNALCLSIGLNPLTRPFGYFKDDDGKIVMYARKECAEQLRKRERVSVKETGREWIEEHMLAISVTASTPDGREEDEIGIVYLANKDGKPYTGQYRANMMMKCLTKAKRRATLGLVGLGFPSEDDMQPAQVVHVDMQTGEVLEPEALPAPAPAKQAFAAIQDELYGEQTPEHDPMRGDQVEILRTLIRQMGMQYSLGIGPRNAWISEVFAENGWTTLEEIDELWALNFIKEHIDTRKEQSFALQPVADEEDAAWQDEAAQAEMPLDEKTPKDQAGRKV